MRVLFFFLIVSASLASGCAPLAHSVYHAPDAPLPAHYRHASSEPADVQMQEWWQRFNDPALDAWLALALSRNADLAVAEVRMRRAALEAKLAGYALFPRADANIDAQQTLSSAPSRHGTEPLSSTLDITWDIDLFNRLGASRDAAALTAQASEQNVDNVRLEILHSAAELYWRLAHANEEVAMAQRELERLHRLQAFVNAQHDAGVASDVGRREAALATVQQQMKVNTAKQVRAGLRQTMMALVDGAAFTASEPQQLPENDLPAIGVGLPADLLGRRADLRAAELKVRAALAASDAAYAEYYPTFSLTGNLGGSSASLLNNPTGATEKPEHAVQSAGWPASGPSPKLGVHPHRVSGIPPLQCGASIGKLETNCVGTTRRKPFCPFCDALRPVGGALVPRFVGICHGRYFDRQHCSNRHGRYALFHSQSLRRRVLEFDSLHDADGLRGDQWICRCYVHSRIQTDRQAGSPAAQRTLGRGLGGADLDGSLVAELGLEPGVRRLAGPGAGATHRHQDGLPGRRCRGLSWSGRGVGSGHFVLGRPVAGQPGQPTTFDPRDHRCHPVY